MRRREKMTKVFQWEITSAPRLRPVGVRAAVEGSGCQGDAPSCADDGDGSTTGDCTGGDACVAAWMETPGSPAGRRLRGRTVGK